MALGEHVEVAEEVVEHADDLGRREPLRERGEVHDVGEQDRRRAELVGDRLRLGLEPVGDRPRQDVEQQALRPRLLLSQRRERVPALAGEHGQQREDDRAADRTLRASIVLVNHTGTAGDTPPSSSPAMPEPRNTTTYATYQRLAARTSLNTSAPSGARIPHRPTPPESRKPPSGIIDSVGASRIATWPTSRNWSKFRVREKTTMDASRTTKYTSGTQPTGDPKAR